jgi:transporter family-2 protein
MTQHRPGFAPVFSAFATIVAGVAMAVQGTANGTLGEILGNGIFAATVSFLVGLVFLTVLSLSLPGARRGLAKAYRIVRTGEFPWWMTLGGLAGTLTVIAQAFTVPLIGVAVFTMAYVAGQLLGALGVDSTRLPPGGPKPPTPWRIGGSVIVLIGVGISAVGVLGQGVPLWAPILPFLAGAATTVQQATNGRLRFASGSAIASTFTNFLVGSALLVLVSAGLFAFGTRIESLPALPSQWWVLIGGLLGMLFIGITTQTVAHLGVLLLSLMSLFGNLVGSLVIDLTFHSAHAEVTGSTYVSMVIVLVGVAITTIPPGRITKKLR